MKRFAILSAFLILAACTSKEPQRGSYLEAEELPNAVEFMPGPPADNSPLFYADSCIYQAAKELRSTPRGETAVADAVTKVDYLAEIFSEPFGYEISQEKTPEIFLLLKRSIPTVRRAAKTPKKVYMRKRPFVRYNESSGTPDWDEEMRGSGSYPSGHSVRGWGIALILSEVNPAAQDALLARGYEYGQSRVIIGVHYQSDVEAGRLVASAAVARMHADKAFCRQLKKAKREFARISR